MSDKTGFDRVHRLWAEVDFRQKAIFRMYPHAKIRTTRGGQGYDPSQPSVVLVIMGETADDVVYDHELTMLSRAIDEELGKLQKKTDTDWPDNHPGMQMNKFLVAILACACSDDTWNGEARSAWDTVRGKSAVDQLAELEHDE